MSQIAPPTALATDAAIGRLTVRVEQAVLADGNATIANLSGQSDAPPDGLAYVLAEVTVRNDGDRPALIAASDFPFTGTDGVLRRCPSIALPDPPLDAAIAPGESATGWTAGLVNDTASVLMLIDPAVPFGPRFGATFDLSGGATLPAFDAAGDPSGAGADIAAPAGIGETVSTTSWDITITEVIDVGTYFELSDYRVQALGAPSANGWDDLGTALGLRVTARNRAERPAFLSWSALELVAPDGEPWDHLLAVTQPNPPVSVELLPGASWDGWYGIMVLPWATNRLARFRESSLAQDPRFITLDGSAGAQPEPEPVAEPLTVEPGDIVTVAEDTVNVRAEASTSAEIVTEVTFGTELAITGPVVEADGYRWYPVELVATGQAGFIAEDFVSPTGD